MVVCYLWWVPNCLINCLDLVNRLFALLQCLKCIKLFINIKNQAYMYIVNTISTQTEYSHSSYTLLNTQTYSYLITYFTNTLTVPSNRKVTHVGIIMLLQLSILLYYLIAIVSVIVRFSQFLFLLFGGRCRWCTFSGSIPVLLLSSLARSVFTYTVQVYRFYKRVKLIIK